MRVSARFLCLSMAYFKYLRFERFASLRGGRIRFTQPGAFNDPFEMPAFKAAEAERMRSGLAGLTQQTAEITGGLSEGRIPEAAFIPPIFYWLGQGAAQPRPEPPIPSEASIERLKSIDTEFGILSLAMTADNLLLWAHYADEHRGLAVELDPGDPVFNSLPGAPAQFQLARPVRYSPERPQIPESEEILFEHFFTKSPEWAYEEEFRIVRRLSSSIERIGDAPIPIHLFEIPPSMIHRVIFGARVPAKQRDSLIAETRAMPALAHVGYAEAVIDPYRFRLEIRPYELAAQLPDQNVGANLAAVQAKMQEIAATLAAAMPQDAKKPKAAAKPPRRKR